MSAIMFQTIKRDSLFQRLDFRPKLLLVVIITVIAFIWESPLAGAGLVVLLTVCALAVGVKWSYIRLIVSIMLVFGLFLVVTHGFFNTSQVQKLAGRPLTVLYTVPARVFVIGGIQLTLEGILYGLNALCKTLSMIIVIPMAVFTTDIDRMVIAMVKMRIPYKLTFVFSSTIRFFPLLFDEMRGIIEAQRLRGLPVEKMGPVKRVRVYAKVAVPLVLGAMVKSQTIEVVLQSKAFSGSRERTYLHDSRLTAADWAVMVVFILLFIAGIATYYMYGFGSFGWLLFT